MNRLLFKHRLYSIYALAEMDIIIHIRYLTTDMKMKSDELNMLQMTCYLDYLHHIGISYSEFILGFACCDELMGMRSHIWINTQAYTRYLVVLRCNFIDNMQFRYALYIKAQYIVLQSQ